MKSLDTISIVAKKLAPGREPTFLEAHVIAALRIVSREATIGRSNLSRTLGLSEGTTRTLIKHLRREDVFEVTRSGIVLSKLGRQLLSELESKISNEIEVPKSPLTVGEHNLASLVRQAAGAVAYGLEQRDMAIKAGAMGATTLVYRSSKLAMPGTDENVFQDTQPIRELLISKLKPRENDVVIIGSADSRLSAEIGALAAALGLLRIKESKQTNPLQSH
ncbi:MAG: hypothetical protein JSV58_05645 [Candidatus Bathyarchaeota archaeon]|nr:MAG: hypothetical protein JSV58_05645 [Candidatus Bathyarchaeota archaeon]